MRHITSYFFFLVFLFCVAELSSQLVEPLYTDSLRTINERIRYSLETDNYSASAKAYYDRAIHNFKVHLKNQDVIEDLIRSGRLYRRIKDDYGFYKARLALADFYIHEEIFLTEALELTREAYDYYTASNNPREAAISVTQLGKVYQKKLEYQEAINYVDEGLRASIELGDVRMELENRLLITQLFSNLGNVENVLVQGEYIINKEQELGLSIVSAEVYYLLGSTLTLDDQLVKAKDYLKKSVATNNGINDLSFEANSLLSKAYYSLDSVELAFNHLQRANDITTELYNQEKFALANVSAVKYQSSEKEKEIRELKEDISLSDFKLTQRTRLFLIGATIAFLIALVFYNYIRSQRQRLKMERILGKQKEEIAQQKIIELESSHKIENLESMVLGQEAERTRIAQDLHDSLGGSLSTLKLQYDALQIDHNDLSKDNSYNKIMGMIDDACTEVRDIARNLKPIALEKLGLTAALKDLINRYSIKDELEISLHTHQVDGILSKEAKLHVYRIIQELLNNALKHAEASEIQVQLNKLDEELFIMVEDNGNGFDLERAKQGLGLGNLQSRVNVLRGDMEIDSSQDRGTSVTVHIPITINNLTTAGKPVE